MKTDLQSQLYSAIYACLQPLARFMLSRGMSFKQFADLAKLAFVEEASAQVDGAARRSNDSRVAAKTGISRKEIRRLRDLKSAEAPPDMWFDEDTFGAAARVMHLWQYDTAFIEQTGKPRDLEFDSGEASFSLLVRRCAGDIPPGAVRTELLEAGAIAELDDGRLRALKKFYIPADLDEKTISTICTILFPVSSGLAHNLNPDRPPHGFIQRFAFSESLDESALERFRAWARDRGAEFVEEVNAWLAAHERTHAERGESADPTMRHAGLGVFYYEGPKPRRSIW